MVFRFHYTQGRFNISDTHNINSLIPLIPNSFIGFNPLDTWLKRKHCSHGLYLQKIRVSDITIHTVYTFFNRKKYAEVHINNITIRVYDKTFIHKLQEGPVALPCIFDSKLNMVGYLLLLPDY